MFPGVSGLVMEEDVEDILRDEGRYCIRHLISAGKFFACFAHNE